MNSTKEKRRKFPIALPLLPSKDIFARQSMLAVHENHERMYVQVPLEITELANGLICLSLTQAICAIYAHQ